MRTALTLLSLLLLLFATPAQAQKAVQKVAIVVGANKAPAGRNALRYAHADAKALAQVLRGVGEFPAASVHTLLEPEPAAVLALLDAQIAQLGRAPESMILFYYSGHADTEALYPSGQALLLSELRKRLDNPAVTVRLGVIDSCRGGGWTGTKGLNEVETFDLNGAMTLNNAGSVLIASSSGLEDAHESEQLGGSFFTHHFNAALRGAADKNRDSKVSVTEAFEYAKALTIRDTARASVSPQHPSFRMNLSGRQDLPLASLERGDSWMALKQDMGPLEVVHLQSGLVLLELHPGQRELRVAVPPGRYLVRRREGNKMFAKEYTVIAQGTTQVNEAQLELLGNPALSVKGADGNEPLQNDYYLIAGAGAYQSLSFAYSESALGRIAPAEHALGHLNFGFKNSLGAEFAVPGRLAWRFGDTVEWIPWLGLPYYWARSPTGDTIFALGVGIGLDTWWNVTPHDRLGLNLGMMDMVDENRLGLPADQLHSWATIGYRRELNSRLRLNFGVGYSQQLADDFSSVPSPNREATGANIGIGSVATDGAFPTPLLQLDVSESVTLGVDAKAYVPLTGGPVGFESSLNTTWRFGQLKTVFVD
jgi:hypothetical protein